MSGSMGACFADLMAELNDDDRAELDEAIQTAIEAEPVVYKPFRLFKAVLKDFENNMSTKQPWKELGYYLTGARVKLAGRTGTVKLVEAAGCKKFPLGMKDALYIIGQWDVTGEIYKGRQLDKEDNKFIFRGIEATKMIYALRDERAIMANARAVRQHVIDDFLDCDQEQQPAATTLG